MRKLHFQWLITNVLLIAVVILLVVNTLFLLKSDDNRYAFQVINQGMEIYVFDRRTGKLFITSAQLIGDYNDEVWTELTPTGSGKALSFKQFLRNAANIKLKKQFLGQKEHLQEKVRQ